MNSLNDLRDKVYLDAVKHGLWEDVPPLSEADIIVDEAYEATEALRQLRRAKHSTPDADITISQLKHDFSMELADVIISALSVAGRNNINIDAAVQLKMKLNKERPWKHGKDETTTNQKDKTKVQHQR